MGRMSRDPSAPPLHSPGRYPPKTDPGRADRDRIRQRAGRNKRIAAEVDRLVAEYAEGRAKASCWDALMKVAAK